MKLITNTGISLLIFLIGFISINLITAAFESPFDGNNSIGFPLEFYKYLGGKRSIEPSSRVIFNYWNLLIDIILFGIASIVIENLFRKLKHSKY